MDQEEYSIKDENKLRRNIVCTICGRPLNVAPICSITENDTIRIICGRCTHVNSSGNKLRQHAFENIAHCLTYPCSNKSFGCEEILDWDNVIKHERVCSFKKVMCPLSYTDLFPEQSGCNWVGHAKTLNAHIENGHKESILNPPQIDWIGKKKYNTIFFTKVGLQLITVAIKFDLDKFFCLLMVNGTDTESQCYRYQLELLDENKESSIVLRRNRLQSLENMMDNLKLNEIMLEIDIDRVRDMLRTSGGVIGRFGIIKKNKKEITQITGLKENELPNGQIPSTTITKDNAEVHPLDDQLLQELECPICHEYMVPPIYICKTGHSICGTCKGKVIECPSCRGVLSSTRNFTLEKLTSRVYYPCSNREIGCAVITTSDSIRQHEDICPLRDVRCLLNCNNRFQPSEMMKHLLDQHADSFILPDTFYICDVTGRTSDVFALDFQGDLFRVSIKGRLQHQYCFFISHLCMDEERKNQFQYNLILEDPVRTCRSITFTDVCSTWSGPNDGPRTDTIVQWDLFQSFIHQDNYFSYKIIIKRQ